MGVWENGTLINGRWLRESKYQVHQGGVCKINFV